MMDGFECRGFSFYSNFDSGNLHKVVPVPEGHNAQVVTLTGKTDVVDYEFNLWTKHDCGGTEFENGNRTWFYFAVKCTHPSVFVKFNIIDMNKQAKLYGQGMVPVYKTIPGRQHWDRIPEKPSFVADDQFTLSFKFKMPENIQSMTYFAFTYPFSFHDLQVKLDNLDRKQNMCDTVESLDDIYYVRENLCYTVQGRNVDLLTVSSYHGITDQRETRLRHLFPIRHVPRPYKFKDKKVIFLSARVHPGETPSSFVLNGFISMLLMRDDHTAQALRRMYVFKIIPCLNPDGVFNGHYRTDTRGVNLNRVYLNPSPALHPTIYAARAIICYHHYGYYEAPDIDLTCLSEEGIVSEVNAITLEDKNTILCNKCVHKVAGDSVPPQRGTKGGKCTMCGSHVEAMESGLFLYLDMHGHASKKGIFMYGNHFKDLESNVNCMVLPKLMSLNNPNFHFAACNFTERNMYLKDKRDGMSREGSGRVAVYKLTGLIQSYTLECNYNTGRLVNILPPCIKDCSKSSTNFVVPPKYSPFVFEEVGRALGASILDLTNGNPHSRVPHSEYHSLTGMREWLKIHSIYNLGDTCKQPKTTKFRQAASLHAQGRTNRPMLKTRSFPSKFPKKPGLKQRTQKHPKRDVVVSQPSCSHNYNSPSGSSSGGGVPTRRKLANTKKPLQAKKRQAVKHVTENLCKGKLKGGDARTSGMHSSNVKVREICYVKNEQGKRVIATYERDNKIEAENLVVAWDATNTHAQVFTHSSRTCDTRNMTGDSQRPRGYRVHNAANGGKPTSSKIKNTKRPLRASAANPTVSTKEEVRTKKSKRKTAPAPSLQTA